MGSAGANSSNGLDSLPSNVAQASDAATVGVVVGCDVHQGDRVAGAPRVLVFYGMSLENLSACACLPCDPRSGPSTMYHSPSDSSTDLFITIFYVVSHAEYPMQSLKPGYVAYAARSLLEVVLCLVRPSAVATTRVY